MPPSVAQTAVRRIFAAADGWVNFVFQGGEPTLAGLEYFEDFVELCKKYASDDEKAFVNGVLSSVSKEEK